MLSWQVQNLLRSDGEQRNYSKAKFPSNLNCGQKSLMKRAPGVYYMYIAMNCTVTYCAETYCTGAYSRHNPMALPSPFSLYRE